jgi:hypothetical protein
VAFANDEGAILVRASVVQGATRISLGVFDGPYPHLAWNLIFVVMDLLVAALLVAGVYRIVPRLGMLPNQPQESASRKASNRES